MIKEYEKEGPWGGVLGRLVGRLTTLIGGRLLSDGKGDGALEGIRRA